MRVLHGMLHEIDTSELGIVRRRCGRGFSYRTESGGGVDQVTRARIDDLVIPPAWREVRVAADPDAHIQAIGTDDAGRRQYIYHPEWVDQRAALKFDRVRSLADHLPALRSGVREALGARGATEERVTAAALRLLDLGAFRIGNDEYLADNGSHGLATLLRSHVTVTSDGLTFSYGGKSGVAQRHTIVAPELISVVKAMRRGPTGGRFLIYRTDAGWRDLTADRINSRLKELVGDDYTAKDLRTWNATAMAALLLAARRTDTADPAGLLRDVVSTTAESLGNTPAVTRSSYIDPRLIEACGSGTAITWEGPREWSEICADDAARADLDRAVAELLDAVEI